jgi:hypothetical protein
MKAVGQAFEIALRIRLDEAKLIAAQGTVQGAVQRIALPLGLADEQPRKLARSVQKPLCDADIDHQHVGHELRLHLQWRQRCATARRQRSALGTPEIGERLGRDQRLSGRRDEALQAGPSDGRRVADLGRQCHRLDAEQAIGSSADLHAAFQNRRYRPAGAAQLDEHILRECRAVPGHQHGGPRAAEHGGRAVVGVAGLQVQRLDAAPQRCRGNQPDQQGRKLHRMPPPMAGENRQDPARAFHVTSPA